MEEFFIFCNPTYTYKRKLELDIAREYEKMAIDDYDELLSFDSKYADKIVDYNGKPTKQVEVPDYERKSGGKEFRSLWMSVFVQQPVTRVGHVIAPFLSTSYLFNPESKIEGAMLPDLDVVQISGEASAGEAARVISNFYEKYGWRTYVFDGKINFKEIIMPFSNRFNGEIQIVPDAYLKEIAKEKVGYVPNILCFQP